MTEENANVGKQAKDIAEAAGTSVEAIRSMAEFLDSAFGNIVSNSVGLMGDKLAYYRLEKAIALQEAVDAKLAGRGAKKKYIPVSFGLPLIEKATVEEEPALANKWTNLLTNALDAGFGKPVRRNFTTILGDMEAIDARILDVIVREHINNGGTSSSLYSREKLTGHFRLAANEVENSIRNLMRLGLFKPGVVEGGVSMGGHKVSSYKDTEIFGVTGLGIDFFYAVSEDGK